MRGLHRAVVTGAFAGLAGVMAVASVAFACTDDAIVRVSEFVNDPAEPGAQVEVPLEVAEPGQQVEISTDYFYPLNDLGVRPGHVVVVLMPHDRPGLYTPAPLPLTILPPLDGRGTAILPAADQVDDGAYTIAARQFSRETGKLVGEASKQVTIQGGRLKRAALPPPSSPRGDRVLPQTTTPATQAPTTGPSMPGSAEPLGNEGTAVSPPVPAPAGVGGPAPARAGAGTRPGSGTGSGSGSGGGADSGQGRGGPSDSGGTGGPGGPGGGRTLDDDVLANIPAIPGSDAAKMLDRLNGLAEPVTGDLWSGLDPSRAPSLLEAGAPTEHGSGFPLGGLLLGGGALALAAVALVEGRRRLAFSRVTLR